MAQHYVRLAGGIVAEVVTLPDEVRIETAFPAPIAAGMRRLQPGEVGVVGQDWRLVNGAFVAPTPAAPPIAYVPVPLARERLEADGFYEAFAAILAAPENAAVMLKVMTLRSGIDPNDPQAVALISASGADPARILSAPGTVLPPLGG